LNDWAPSRKKDRRTTILVYRGPEINTSQKTRVKRQKQTEGFSHCVKSTEEFLFKRKQLVQHRRGEKSGS